MPYTFLDFNVSDWSRQQRFRVWKFGAGVSYTELARKMGLSHVAVRKLCLGETAPANRLAQLIQLGVPEDLLPKPKVPSNEPNPAAPPGPAA